MLDRAPSQYDKAMQARLQAGFDPMGHRLEGYDEFMKQQNGQFDPRAYTDFIMQRRANGIMGLL